MGLIARFFVVLFFAEMVTLAFFISKFGFLTVFLLCALSALVGGYMVRQGGLATLLSFAARPAANQPPLFEGVFVLISGLLFMFPGFLSDLLALLLLLPTAQSYLDRHLSPQETTAQNNPFRTPPQDGVIEGEFIVVEDTVETLESPKKH